MCGSGVASVDAFIFSRSTISCCSRRLRARVLCQILVTVTAPRHVGAEHQDTHLLLWEEKKAPRSVVPRIQAKTVTRRRRPFPVLRDSRTREVRRHDSVDQKPEQNEGDELHAGIGEKSLSSLRASSAAMRCRFPV